MYKNMSVNTDDDGTIRVVSADGKTILEIKDDVMIINKDTIIVNEEGEKNAKGE